jgi:hypothetical protein
MKLLKAGLEEEAIVEISREQLVNAWAELVAAGREQPKEALAAAAAGKALGCDVDLDRQRLAFEMKKFEREIALNEERLAAERKREEREAAEKEERLAAERKREEREAAEKEERLEREEAAQRLREAELRLQEEQLARQKERDAWDRDRKKIPAAQAKFFGDVLKNVMPKFPSDMADAPIFFAGVEKLFDNFSVPGEFQSKLLMPYLNEKAKSLLLRLDKNKQDVYSEVKKFLLCELKLTRGFYPPQGHGRNLPPSHPYPLPPVPFPFPPFLPRPFLPLPSPPPLPPPLRVIRSPSRRVRRGSL